MSNKTIDSNLTAELDTDLEDAITLMDKLLAPRQLTSVQELVFRQTWSGKTYQDMAQDSSYTTDYIRITGSQLWQILSQVIGRKVTKSNLRMSFRQYKVRLQSPQSPQTSQAGPLFQNQTAWKSTQADPSWQPPLSATELELPVGQVPLDSPLYIERDVIESRCCAAIYQPGALLRIKGTKQAGKTSLMARLLHHAQRAEFATVAINMRQIGLEPLESIDAFLGCFCTMVTRQLGLPNRFSQYQDEICSPLADSTDYFERYLLAEVQSPLVLALDDVDILFDYPTVASNFLGLLRAWYERSRYGITSSQVWQRLRLIVVHSTDAALPLNVHQSPFNVGLSVELPDFELPQLQHLVKRHGLEWLQGDNNERLVSLLGHLGGNPYRLRLALYHLAHGDISLNGILKSGAENPGIYADHLNQQWQRLQRRPDLLNAYARVVRSLSPVALGYRTAADLHSMGLVTLTSQGAVPSCGLYREFFRNRFDRCLEAEDAAIAAQADPPVDHG
ncbi:MAG: AAA-like domain-containing protein [Elainellaceae cyanobacterium]